MILCVILRAQRNLIAEYDFTVFSARKNREADETYAHSDSGWGIHVYVKEKERESAPLAFSLVSGICRHRRDCVYIFASCNSTYEFIPSRDGCGIDPFVKRRQTGSLNVGDSIQRNATVEFLCCQRREICLIYRIVNNVITL